MGFSNICFIIKSQFSRPVLPLKLLPLVIKKCGWVCYFPSLAGTAGLSDLKRVFYLTAAYLQLQAGPRRPRRTVAFGSWTSWLSWNRFKACVVLSHPSLRSESPLPALPSYQALFFAKCFHICYLISSNNSVRLVIMSNYRKDKIRSHTTKIEKMGLDKNWTD